MAKTKKNSEQQLLDQLLSDLDPALPLEISSVQPKEPKTPAKQLDNVNLERDKVNREQLAILVATGKSQEAVGVHLTHDKVKNLSDKEVEKLVRRYETYVGSKTTDSLISSGIYLLSKLVGMAVEIDDVEAYQRELKEDYIISHELANLAGNLAFTCGRYLALANAALITAKHANFSPHGSEKFKDVSSAKFPEHSSAIPEQVVNSGEQLLDPAEQ